MKIYKLAQYDRSDKVDYLAKSKGYNIGPVFHGRAEPFNVFESRDSIRGFDKHRSPSFFFTESPSLADAFGIDRMQHIKNPKMDKISVYLSLKNPIDLTKKTPELIDILVDIGENREDLEELGTNFYWQIADDDVFVNQLIQRGYDGAICDESDAAKHFKLKASQGSLTYAVFKPSQIKLADPITYDDSGNEITLESRFDINNSDIRY